jgi:hypothetical protein
MTWCWLALTDARPAGATAAAPATDARNGSGAGWLALWDRRARPARDARRVDRRLLDPSGGPALVSLVRPRAGLRLPFDDVAVQQARRDVLARPPADALSTLLSDASHFEGAITVARGPRERLATDDPFARVFGRRLLRVGPGALGVVPAPPGPTIERYGSAEPWPWDRFAS